MLCYLKNVFAPSLSFTFCIHFHPCMEKLIVLVTLYSLYTREIGNQKFWFYFYFCFLFIMNLFYFYFYNEQGNRKCSQLKIVLQLSLLDDQLIVTIKIALLSLLCFFVPRKAPVECFLKKCYFTNLVLI